MNKPGGLRRLIALTGYRITRLAPNRFDAMEPVLKKLRRLGFNPQIIIDAGANLGLWTTMARSVFPDAAFHVIEPQRECAAALNALPGGVRVHAVALSRPGIAKVRMAGAGTTGAWVVDGPATAVESREVPASTLDALIGDTLSAAKRPLLKLDLEGYEMAALEGAEAILPAVEVIITEVRLFDVHHGGLPVLADLVLFLRARGFEVYDVAALSSRPSDGRLRTGDLVFVRSGSPLLEDVGSD